MDENTALAQARAHMMYDANRKSVGAAYVLLIFLGGFGAHRFYLGRSGPAVVQLLMLLFGWIPVGAGWIALGVWLIVDLFLIPNIVRDENMKLADRFAGAPRRV